MKIYKIKVNGKAYKVELESIEQVASAEAPKIEEKKADAPKAAVGSGEGKAVESPIQGTVMNIKVAVGAKVKKGDVLVIVEAMKLENEVVSTYDGVVSEILVSKGQAVTAKQPLFIIK